MTINPEAQNGDTLFNYVTAVIANDINTGDNEYIVFTTVNDRNSIYTQIGSGNA
jgi:hypothetical protein